MRVLVCGGRNYSAADACNWLNRYAKCEIEAVTRWGQATIDCVIHGGARGADEGAAMWGKDDGVQTLAFPAEWKKYGNSAGPRRNEKMLREGKPDIVIAFPGGKGTASMVRLARGYGLTVIEVSEEP